MAVVDICRGEGVEIRLSEPELIFSGKENTYTAKLTITEAANPNRDKEYEALCRKVGFTQNVIGREFEKGGTLYQIVNIKPRNRKYPVIAASRLGQLYKFSVEGVKKSLGGDQLINRNANLDKLIQ